MTIPTLALQPLTTALLECVTPAEVISAVVERGVATLGAEAGLVALVHEEAGVSYLDIVGAHGYSDVVVGSWERFPLMASLPLSDAVREQKSLFSTGYDDLKASYPEMFAQGPMHPVKASVSLPLMARGRALGGLHFSFPEERETFLDTDRVFLDELARQCAIALDRALLLEEIEGARRRQEFLAHASALLAESLDYETTLHTIARLAVPDLCDWITVDLLDPAEQGEENERKETSGNSGTTVAAGVLRLAVVAHIDPVEVASLQELRWRSPIDLSQKGQPPVHAILTGETVFLPEITPEAVAAAARDEDQLRHIKRLNLRALMSVPLRTARNATLGALTLAISRASVRAFSPETVALAEELAHRAAVAVDNARLFEQAQREVAERTQAEVERERLLSQRERLLAEQQKLLAEQARLVSELETANARQGESLRQSEERFRLLVEGVRDYAIFLLDTEGRVATWNAGAERFKGYKGEEIIGQHFSRFYTPEDIARRHPWNELEIAAREGRYEEEGWRVRKDGSHFWANVLITALRDKNGELRGFGKVTRDVTERRLHEQERAATQALEQQRRFLKDVLASVTQGRLALCDNADELPAPLSPEPMGAPLSLSRRTLKAVRSRVAAVAGACAIPKERAQDLITASSECAMNAVVHAGGGTARVYGDAEAGRMQVWVEDTGKGIDLSNLPRATLEAGFSTGGGGIGHGFSLMIAFCRRVYLLTGVEGTTIVLEQTRQAPEPAWLQLVPSE